MRGYVSVPILFSIFLFLIKRILKSRIPTFFLFVFGFRHCSTFWVKCRNGFYWSMMSGALSDAEVTMLSASSNRINRCCDSRAFYKRPWRRSIFPQNWASISVVWWKDKVSTSFDFITVTTILTTCLVTIQPTVQQHYSFTYCLLSCESI